MDVMLSAAEDIIWLLSTYLLLTEFEGRTVSYGPRFSPSIYGPNGKRGAGHKSKGKNEDP